MSAASNRYNESRRKAAMEALKEMPAMQAQIDDLETYTKELEGYITDLGTKVKELERQQAGLIEANGQLKSRVADLEARIEALERR